MGPQDAVAGGHEDPRHEADGHTGHGALQRRCRADVGQPEEAGRGQHVAGAAGEQGRHRDGEGLQHPGAHVEDGQDGADEQRQAGGHDDGRVGQPGFQGAPGRAGDRHEAAGHC